MWRSHLWECYAIAIALVSNPQLVLADEPTAALDSKSGRDVVEILQKLARDRGCTILLVTQDNRILDIADRIIYMEDGQLINKYKSWVSLPLNPTYSNYSDLGLKVEATCNSFNCLASTCAGASVSKQLACCVFGKAITSRIEPSPANNITKRSKP